ncbi:MAG: hypothetical protein AAGE94_15955, partial [Acidobacteriota bacterium]
MSRWPLGFLALSTAVLFAYGTVGPDRPVRSAERISQPALATAGTAHVRDRDGRHPAETVMSAHALLDPHLAAPEATHEGGKPRIRVLFVHVPDPIDTSLDWAYDSMFFAFRKGMETSGFVATDRWLPWIADRRAMSRRRPDDPELRRDHPGVVLFRATEAAGAAAPRRQPPTAVLAFVIGEGLLAGVHRDAFASALEQRRARVDDPS